MYQKWDVSKSDTGEKYEKVDFLNQLMIKIIKTTSSTIVHDMLLQQLLDKQKELFADCI